MLASKILASGIALESDLLTLSESLPRNSSARSSGLVSSERTHTTGGFRHGGVTGLRTSCRDFPVTTRLLATLATHLFPGMPFTTVSLIKDTKAARHADIHNLKGSVNGLAALSSFQGGGLLVHRPDGPCTLDLQSSPQIFDPTHEHSTESWHGGARLVLAAYCVSDGFSQADCESLIKLGFCTLPQFSAGEHPAPTWLCIEVFAGSARLSQALQDSQFSAIAVDHKDKSGHPILRLDLTNPAEAQILLDLIREHARIIRYIHLAPPCGTCSAARSKPIASFERAGVPSPAPLRSLDHILGFPHLSGTDLLRTSHANKLYEVTAQILLLADSLHIAVSLENPSNSLFWSIPCIASALASIKGFDVHFAHCMHGGRRDKKTCWWSNRPWFAALEAPCSRDHPHSSWAPRLVAGKPVFPTAEEAAYPHLLCKRVACLVLQRGGPLEVPKALHGPSSAITRLVWEKPSRRFLSLVPEYTQFDMWAVPLEQQSRAAQILKCYPKGARVCDRRLCRWGEVRACIPPRVPFKVLRHQLGPSWSWCQLAEGLASQPVEDGDVSVVCGMCSPSNFVETAEILVIGVPRSPEVFLQEAVKAGHPKNKFASQMDDSATRLINNLFQGVLGQNPGGEDILTNWQSRKHSLEDKEKEIKASLDPTVARILEKKSTELESELLRELDYPDKSLVPDMRSGFNLTGWIPTTGVHDPDVRPPKSSVDIQMISAKARNTATLQKMKLMVVDDVAKETWNETKKELDNDWLFEDVSPDLNKVLIAPRFGVQQGLKTRVIDNGKSCGINSTTGLPERFRLHGIDYLACLLTWAMSDPRSVGARLVGKTIDLTSAYKQYAVKPTDRALLRIYVKDTDSNTVRTFGSNVLPFGTTGSVGGFLRTSSATWFIGAFGLGLCWVSYFDDYPLLALEQHSPDADRCAQGLFDVLGIAFAREGKKATSFASQFKALGLLVDLSNFGEGRVVIRHTPERVMELRATLLKVLETDKLEPAAAESLRGRLHWFSSFLFGRRSSIALGEIGKRANGINGHAALGDDLRKALLFLKDEALEGEPLVLDKTPKNTFLIFTDGSLEGDVGMLGGILYDARGNPLSFFSGELQQDVMSRLYSCSDHPIYEVELLAAWTAISVWGEELKDSFSCFYLDNEGAKGGLISCKSSTEHGSKVVHAFVRIEDKIRCRAWFSRVPSASNPSDGPSRGEFSDLLRAGVHRAALPVVWPV